MLATESDKFVKDADASGIGAKWKSTLDGVPEWKQ